MPSWPPPRFSSWSCDESNRLILLKIPSQVKVDTIDEKPLPPSLSTLDKPTQPPRIAPTLPSLPPELHYTILHHLAPVDRVCLALTCRRLCSSVLTSPRLTPETWLRFTTITDFSNRYWNPNADHLNLAPEHYQLCQRLAHGWVDKKRWRYCWKCHKILPRNEDYWVKMRDNNGDRRIKGRKTPRWSAKTGVEQEEWLNWNKKKRLKWIVNVWCNASWEDSSAVGCDWCRDNLYAEDVERMRREIAEPKGASVSSSREMDLSSFVGKRHPVECPSCLERELTFSWKPPRRAVFRKVFWSTVGCFRDWGIGIIWCIGSSIIELVMLIWQCIECLAGVIVRTFLKFVPVNRLCG